MEGVLRTLGGMGWWTEMGPNGSNEVRIRDGVGGVQIERLWWQSRVEPGSQLRWSHLCISPHSPFSILGPLMFSSPLSAQAGSQICWWQRRVEAVGLGLAQVTHW